MASMNMVIIGSGNVLSPVGTQATVRSEAHSAWKTYCNQTLFTIQTFSLKKMYLKMLSAKYQPFCWGLHMLTDAWYDPTRLPGNCLVLCQRRSLYFRESTEWQSLYVGIILGMGSTNERRHYIVMSSLIGWAHTQNDPRYVDWWWHFSAKLQ